MQEDPPARTVLLGCDVRVVVEALNWAIPRSRQYVVVGAGLDCRELLQLAAALKPDLILAESAIARASGFICGVVRESPSTKTVAFAVLKDHAEILECIEAGVCGFALRDASLQQIVQALDAAVRGEAVCPPEIVACAFARIANLAAHRHKPMDRPRLPDRQSQILALIKDGLTNKEIAKELGIELSTVKNHVHALFTNMGVRRRSQAIAKFRSSK